jgi:hypothetical protein
LLKRRVGRWIAIPVALMSVTGLAVMAAPIAASASPEYQAIYNETSSNKCLTNGGSTANGAVITQYTSNGSSNQNWEYTNSDQFENQVSGKCLTNGGSTGNSTDIQQYTCNGSSNQGWL